MALVRTSLIGGDGVGGRGKGQCGAREAVGVHSCLPFLACLSPPRVRLALPCLFRRGVRSSLVLPRLSSPTPPNADFFLRFGCLVSHVFINSLPPYLVCLLHHSRI